MASMTLVLFCVFVISLIIVSQGVLAARELTETVQVNRDGAKTGRSKGVGAVTSYGGGWSGSYRTRP
ncbi:hypothetical protein ACP70R_047283 [Stipagrostis hirtigluma subsp. patula]